MARSRLLIALLVLCAMISPALAIAAETQTYTYDALGRLIKVETTGGRVTQYTYDAANNRTQVTSSGKVVVLPLLGGLVLPLP